MVRTSLLLKGLLIQKQARWTRFNIPALPFCKVTLKAERPISPAYPKSLKTFGDHLRKRRLDLSLQQKDVSRILGVTKNSIWNWENNLASPSLYHILKIIEFLGYVPYKTSPQTLGEKKGNARLLFGLTLKELARRLCIDSGTLSNWEKGKGEPSKKHLKKLSDFFTSLPSLAGGPEE
jgi:transcriptional regulator with XRE-family HTH domain